MKPVAAARPSRRRAHLPGVRYQRSTGPHLGHGDRKRQRQILAMLANGPMTTREVADALGIHPTHASVMLKGYGEKGDVASHPAFLGGANGSRYSLKRWTLPGAPVPKPDPIPTPAAAAPKPERAPKVAKVRKVRAPKPPKVKPVKPVKVAKTPKPAKPTKVERERANLAKVTAAAALATIAASPTAKPSKDPETVDEFLARGGRIQQLGACEYVPAPSRPMRCLT